MMKELRDQKSSFKTNADRISTLWGQGPALLQHVDSALNFNTHVEKAWKLEILSGSYMPPFFLRTSLMNLPRSLSRAAAGIFVTSKIFSQPFTLSPSYLVFFTVFDNLSAAMKSDSLVLDSSNLRRTRLSLYFACFPPNTLRNQIGISTAECCFLLRLRAFPFSAFSSTFWLS